MPTASAGGSPRLAGGTPVSDAQTFGLVIRSDGTVPIPLDGQMGLGIESREKIESYDSLT